MCNFFTLRAKSTKSNSCTMFVEISRYLWVIGLTNLVDISYHVVNFTEISIFI